MTPSEHLARLAAALEGRYRIERQLGEGGMATVYLADDQRHGRKVALKVLKPELAAVVGAERFLAEIKTTANLQHPHILPLFDSGEGDGFLFYVMPYVEGESLREKLDRERQLPVNEAVRIATNVAEALDYAHRHGVIHRDIKPANILLQDGKPVVSDFGIALAVGVAGGGRLTETGLSLGTPHYMSPEQATGDMIVGAATDIYALGCVLYEMLVGEPPYTGSTAQAVLGKIVTGDADAVTKHRRQVPPNVDAAIRRALEKVPADRFAAAGDLANALADQAFRHGTKETSGVAASGPGFWRALAVVASVIAVVLAGVSASTLRRPAAQMPVARFQSPFSPGQEPTSFGTASFTLSPDGSLLVYRGPGPGRAVSTDNTQLWVRRLRDFEATPLRGTEGAVAPTVSPDGERLAFVSAAGEVSVLTLAGGPVTTLGQGIFPRWGPDGYVYFTGESGGWAIRRAPAAGGTPEVVRTLAEGESAQWIWDFLPGGDAALIFVTRSGAAFQEIGVLTLATGEMTVLLPGQRPRFLGTGHLVFVAADSSLMAAPFDPESLEVGPPVPLVDNVLHSEVSRTGSLAYTTYPAAGSVRSRLLLVGPADSPEVLSEVEGSAWFPRFSPDGTRVAYAVGTSRSLNDASDLWVIEVSRGARTRVTFTGNNRFYPIWTRDGTRLTYADGTAAQNHLLSSPADGSGGSDTLLPLGDRRYPSSWSPDGGTLAYYVGPAGTPTNTRDVWMLQVNGDVRTAVPFIQTEFMERGALFSPDGTWVAYVSDKSGQNDVYARPYPGPGPEVTVSVGGGSEPVWGPRGDRLYYRRENELMVVDIEHTAQSLTVGTPRRVMDDRYARDVGGAAGGMANYDIAPSGTQFIMVEDAAEEGTVEPSRLYLVLNFLEELRERVPN